MSPYMDAPLCTSFSDAPRRLVACRHNHFGAQARLMPLRRGASIPSEKTQENYGSGGGFELYITHALALPIVPASLAKSLLSNLCAPCSTMSMLRSKATNPQAAAVRPDQVSR